MLTAISKNIPVHHFIAIDCYSIDGTLDVVRQFFGDKLIAVKTRASLGLARYIGIKLVDTKWFAFIDSDVEILDGWYKEAEPLMGIKGVMGIQGCFVHSVKRGKDKPRVEVIRDIRKVPSKNIIKEGFYRFAGADTGHVLLHNSVIKLLDPRIISLLNAGEDMYIAQEIVKNGHYYVRTTKLRAIHYTRKISMEKFLRNYAHALAMYLDPLTFIGYNSCRLLGSLKNRDPSSFIDHLFLTLGVLKAYSDINWRRLSRYVRSMS